MKDPPTKLRRIQIDLTERSMRRLENLKDKTEATSYAEVLREALTLYERIVDEHEQGRTLLIQDKDGKPTPVLMFNLATSDERR